MTPLRRIKLAVVALTIAAAACSDKGPTNIKPPTDTTSKPQNDTIPPVLAREMRGVWIATVSNIDWPSRTGLTADQQKAELIDLLDRARTAGINTIVFHVRPAANALYRSQLEPWGQMFTGVQGADPGYDPLQFAIDESHARGMELHAWINPFRAGSSSDTISRLAATHVWYTKHNLVRVYGTQLWLDPGDPTAQDWSMAVIKDIVTRYDIDGLHADDYFYPYVENDAAGKPIPFPDDSTFARYNSTGLNIGDWRRANIDRFIQRMYTEVHAIKPLVKVGLSPFGIWRPGYPTGVTGLDAYASIYADSRKWLQNGWLDYLAPQLYWSIASTGQSYPALFDWWLAQSSMGRHVWPGLAAYRVQDGTSSAFSTAEIPNQITTTRSHNGNGNILYNATWTLKKNNLASTLASDLYKQAALVPASPWLDSTPPNAPALSVSSGGLLTITPGAGEAARWWALRTHSTVTGWTTKILFGNTTTDTVLSNVDRILVQAVDKAGNTSAAVEWRR